MWQVTVAVEYNGIVLFDPQVVREELGTVRKGTNLFRRFTTSQEGDRVLSRGIFVPIMAIDDAGYDIILRMSDEPSRVREEYVLTENSAYALKVNGSLAVADLEALMFWGESPPNNVIEFPFGRYSVAIRGFSAPDLSTAGYEFVFSRVSKLPKVTADTGAKMRVLRQ
jgi:hypothetical protein